MNLSNRLAKIKDRKNGPEWTERTAFEMPERPQFGLGVREQHASRREPMVSALAASRIIFVDFCPGGVVCNRQDIAWIKQGVCIYETFSSDEQWEMFQSIAIGDILVMKKSSLASKTMLLQAYGRVFGFDLTEKRDRLLLINWKHDQGQIELPLFEHDEMLVNLDHGALQAAMPPAFWDWLK